MLVVNSSDYVDLVELEAFHLSPRIRRQIDKPLSGEQIQIARVGCVHEIFTDSQFLRIEIAEFRVLEFVVVAKVNMKRRSGGILTIEIDQLV